MFLGQIAVVCLMSFARFDLMLYVISKCVLIDEIWFCVWCGEVFFQYIQESQLGGGLATADFHYNKTQIDRFFSFCRFSGDLRLICRTKSLKI